MSECTIFIKTVEKGHAHTVKCVYETELLEAVVTDTMVNLALFCYLMHLECIILTKVTVQRPTTHYVLRFYLNMFHHVLFIFENLVRRARNCRVAMFTF